MLAVFLSWLRSRVTAKWFAGRFVWLFAFYCICYIAEHTSDGAAAYVTKALREFCLINDEGDKKNSHITDTHKVNNNNSHKVTPKFP